MSVIALMTGASSRAPGTSGAHVCVLDLRRLPGRVRPIYGNRPEITDGTARPVATQGV